MPRYSRLLQLILVLGLTFVCGIQSSQADGILLPEGHDYGLNSSDIFILFSATVAVEYVVIYLLLGSPASAKWALFIWVFVVTLITNPAAQITFFYLSVLPGIVPPYFTWMITILLVTELLVVAVEYALLRLAFKWMHNGGILDEPVTAGRTLKITVLANVASVVFGFIGLFIWRPMWMLDVVQ